MSAVRHLEFSKFGILVKWHVSNVILLLRAEFRVNRTINRWDIPKKRFTIWRSAAIMDLQTFDILRRGCYWNQNLHLHTKFRWNRIKSINPINQFNSNLAAREPDSKWYAVEIIDKNSIRNKQCAYIYVLRCWERCVEWVRSHYVGRYLWPLAEFYNINEDSKEAIASMTQGANFLKKQPIKISTDTTDIKLG